VVFAERPCAAVESGFLAAACKHVPELFSYSTPLHFQELVGWCQLGGLQNVSLEDLRHITPRIGFCLCFYPVLGRSTFSGEFFPSIIAQFTGKCKSSQSAPAVEIWLADPDPNNCEVQTT
jgi:hypothetical protein